MRPTRTLLVLTLLLGSPLLSGAMDSPNGDAPPATDANPMALTGRQIYDRMLSNRFEAFEQKARLVSGDRAGNEQESRMKVVWKSFRDDDGNPRRGVLSKTAIRYTHPFDLRFSGYLIINNHERANDQFVYLASSRRVRRVSLRGEAVLGTDFSFEDVIPREIEESDYHRLPDDKVGDVSTYVVEVRPRETADSEYSRFQVWIDPERNVVLRAVYWDQSEVRVKELDSPVEHVQKFEGVYVPMRTDMKNLQFESYTRLVVDELIPNPDIPRATFDPRRLEAH